MLGYAWKSLGWFLAGVAVALGFLLVPLQVAAERKKLDRTVSQIAAAHRDIRALETEFDTRANLAQLEQWNGDTLRLTAPAAAQYVRDEAALAQIDLRQPAPGGATVQTASYVVPSLPAGDQSVHTAPAVLREASVQRTVAVAVAQVRPATIERAKPQTVAMLDRKLLSDSTIGDLLHGARSETGKMR
jgi:hypothetical protein